jgi:hypothetical protein
VGARLRRRASPTRARDTRARLAILPLAAFLSAVLAPAVAAPQELVFRPRVQWEVRADGIFGATSAGQLGVAANLPAGYYVRVGGAVACGPSRRDGHADASARADIVARYLLDPFGEIAWGPYVGAGISAAWNQADPWRSYLLAIIGVEGPVHRGWRTAFEIGLGGGFRAGLALRRARSNSR